MGAIQTTCVSEEDRCPVDHKNMSAAEISQMMEQYKKVGPAASIKQELSPDIKADREALNVSDNPTIISAQSSGCPADRKNMTEEQRAAYLKGHRAKTSAEQRASKSSTVYDVYGQELDRANLMPAIPNQLPSPGQKQPLSTDRVKSSIPKSGENDTWTYPSPQMFYNALKRKGKAHGVEESDMGTVVGVHNIMNERTWEEVMQWEQTYHCNECENPKLKSFMGRPNDLSPAARFRTWFWGYPRPFDRHDWIIDRCGEQTVRYIIDYYYREGPDPIEIHVRPALDSFSAAFDRIQAGFKSLTEVAPGTTAGGVAIGTTGRQSGLPKEIRSHVVSGDQLGKEEFDFLSNLTTTEIKDIGEDVKIRCAKVSEALREVGNNPEKMEKVNVSVNYCMAQRICKAQAANFMKALENGSDEAEAYGKMTSCLERFHIMARRAILEEAGVVQSGPEFPVGVESSVSSSQNQAPASSVE